MSTTRLESQDSLPRNRRTAAFERRVGRALGAALGGPVDVRAERVVVAVSGGPDSTAALIAVARSLGAKRVIAAHFDHRIRPLAERRADRAVVDEVATALGVPVVAGAARGLRGSGEDVLRAARYRWLASACARSGANVCVTGHTLDDQAETVLLRLARGAGALGAAGMTPVALWPVDLARREAPRLVRPLLGVTRVEVEAYLAALGIEASSDPSNESLDYDRNRVRLEVLPALARVNPRAAAHLSAFATASREDEEALSALAADWLRRHAEADREARRVALPRRGVRDLPAAIALRAIRNAARSLGLSVDSAQLANVRHILGRKGARADLAGGVAWTDATSLWIERRER